MLTSSSTASVGLGVLQGAHLEVVSSGVTSSLELSAVLDTEASGVLSIFSCSPACDSKPLLLSQFMGSLLLFEPVVPLRLKHDGSLQAITENEWLEAVGASWQGFDKDITNFSSHLLGIDELVEDEQLKTDERGNDYESFDGDGSDTTTSDDGPKEDDCYKDIFDKDIFVPDFDCTEEDILEE